MFALMNPSRVATPSFTTGTSRGVTVAAMTVGGGGPACSALREQAARHVARIMSGVAHAVFVFMSKVSRRAGGFVKDHVSCLGMPGRHRFKACGASASTLLRSRGGDGKRLPRRDPEAARLTALVKPPDSR